jgi:hypothetical protein
VDRRPEASHKRQQLRVAINRAENQKPDFDSALRQWAASNGFAFEEVDQKVRSWAEDIVAHKQAASLEQQGEAELALRHFEQAGALFEKAANASEEALDKEEEQHLANRRTELRDFVQEKTQAAQTSEFAEQYHLATERADAGSRKAEEEHRKYPNDEVIRQIWLTAAMSAEDMRVQEGEGGVTQDSVQLLQMVAEHTKTLADETDQPGNELHSRALSCKAGVLVFLAVRTNDAKVAAEWLKESTEAFRAASRAIDKNRNPRMWQIVQLELGAALMTQSLIAAKNNGTKTDFSPNEILAEIKPVFDALAVSGDRDLIGDAAVELSVALKIKADNGDESQRLAIYEGIVSAYRTTLGLISRDQSPGMWAMCAGNLGSYLADLATVKTGDESLKLYEESVKFLEDVQRMEKRMATLQTG